MHPCAIQTNAHNTGSPTGNLKLHRQDLGTSVSTPTDRSRQETVFYIKPAVRARTTDDGLRVPRARRYPEESTIHISTTFSSGSRFGASGTQPRTGKHFLIQVKRLFAFRGVHWPNKTSSAVALSSSKTPHAHDASGSPGVGGTCTGRLSWFFGRIARRTSERIVYRNLKPTEKESVRREALRLGPRTWKHAVLRASAQVSAVIRDEIVFAQSSANCPPKVPSTSSHVHPQAAMYREPHSELLGYSVPRSLTMPFASKTLRPAPLTGANTAVGLKHRSLQAPPWPAIYIVSHESAFMVPMANVTINGVHRHACALADEPAQP